MVKCAGLKSYYERHPYRVRACKKLRREVYKGNIDKPPRCEHCHKEGDIIVAHHEDYLLPLDVKWLCVRCHNQRHQQLRSRGWVDCGETVKRNLISRPQDPKHILDAEVEQALEKMLSVGTYTERQKEVVGLRARGYTLAEIGEACRLSREGVRQIINKVEQKYDFYCRTAC